LLARRQARDRDRPACDLATVGQAELVDLPVRRGGVHEAARRVGKGCRVRDPVRARPRRVAGGREAPEGATARRVDGDRLPVAGGDDDDVVAPAVHERAAEVDRRRVDGAVEGHAPALERADVRSGDPCAGGAAARARRGVAEARPGAAEPGGGACGRRARGGGGDRTPGRGRRGREKRPPHPQPQPVPTCRRGRSARGTPPSSPPDRHDPAQTAPHSRVTPGRVRTERGGGGRHGLRASTRQRLSRTRRSSSVLPGSRMASTWSPTSSVVWPSAIFAWPFRTTEISCDPDGSGMPSTGLPTQGESRSICTSTISRFSLRSSSRCTRSCSGTSCSTSASRDSVAQTVGEIPSRSKCGWFRGSLTRAITLGTPYFSRASWQMMMLSSSSPVVATSMSGGRANPACSSTNTSVASPSWTWCSNSSSSVSYRSALCSIIVTSWPWLSRLRVRFAPTFPPPATMRYTALACPDRVDGRAPRRHLARADGLGEDVDRGRGRADCTQASGGVELGAGGVEHPDDDAVDAVAFLRDLGDDEVRVVAVRRDDDRVRRGDPGLLQHGLVHPVADDEPATPVRAEPRQRLLLLVHRDDIPALAVETLGDGRADPAAADDDHLHGLSLAQHPCLVAALAAFFCLVEHSLRKGDDEHLARRLAQHVLDRRREEAGLAPPARGGAEHDQVDVALARLVHDRLADRASADRLADDLDPVVGPERPRLLDRLGRARLVRVERRLEG